MILKIYIVVLDKLRLLPNYLINSIISIMLYSCNTDSSFVHKEVHYPIEGINTCCNPEVLREILIEEDSLLKPDISDSIFEVKSRTDDYIIFSDTLNSPVYLNIQAGTIILIEMIHINGSWIRNMSSSEIDKLKNELVKKYGDCVKCKEN